MLFTDIISKDTIYSSIECDLPLNSDSIKNSNIPLVYGKNKIMQDILLYFQTEVGSVKIDNYTYGSILDQSLYKVINPKNIQAIEKSITNKLKEDFDAYIIVNELTVLQDVENSSNLIISLDVTDILTSEEVKINIDYEGV